MEKLQKAEERLRQKREYNKAYIVNQMQAREDKVKTLKKIEKETPDIRGSEGYPRIPEPSPKEMRDTIRFMQDIQKKNLLQQVILSMLIFTLDTREERS